MVVTTQLCSSVRPSAKPINPPMHLLRMRFFFFTKPATADYRFKASVYLQLTTKTPLNTPKMNPAPHSNTLQRTQCHGSKRKIGRCHSHRGRKTHSNSGGVRQHHDNVSLPTCVRQTENAKTHSDISTPPTLRMNPLNKRMNLQLHFGTIDKK